MADVFALVVGEFGPGFNGNGGGARSGSALSHLRLSCVSTPILLLPSRRSRVDATVGSAVLTWARWRGHWPRTRNVCGCSSGAHGRRPWRPTTWYRTAVLSLGMDGMQRLECTLRLNWRRAERTIALYGAPGTRGRRGMEGVGGRARGMSRGKSLYEQ